MIKSGLRDLKDEIEKMSEDEKEIETKWNIRHCWKNSWV